jgi:hypothetical protein
MKIKALELIRDWSLWPRYEANDLDQTNIRKLKMAISAGISLPPIKADKKSLRIIDGFHRQEAFISLFGENTLVDVELVDYKNETDMFLDSVRENSKHGLKLSPKDITHVFLVGRKKKIPLSLLAESVGMSKEDAQDFLERRTATVASTGEKIPLSAGAMNMAGKMLNGAQEKFARTANGVLPIIHVRLLLNALKANCFPLTDTEITLLESLQAEISRVLQKKAA